MPTCPHCRADVPNGAYACALCGASLLPPARRPPPLRPVAVGAGLGFAAGFALGFRWGGYLPFCLAAPAGLVGLLVGAMAGAAVALAVRRLWP